MRSNDIARCTVSGTCAVRNGASGCVPRLPIAWTSGTTVWRMASKNWS